MSLSDDAFLCCRLARYHRQHNMPVLPRSLRSWICKLVHYSYLFWGLRLSEHPESFPPTSVRLALWKSESNKIYHAMIVRCRRYSSVMPAFVSPRLAIIVFVADANVHTNRLSNWLVVESQSALRRRCFKMEVYECVCCFCAHVKWSWKTESGPDCRRNKLTVSDKNELTLR